MRPRLLWNLLIVSSAVIATVMGCSRSRLALHGAALLPESSAPTASPHRGRQSGAASVADNSLEAHLTDGPRSSSYALREPDLDGSVISTHTDGAASSAPRGEVLAEPSDPSDVLPQGKAHCWCRATMSTDTKGGAPTHQGDKEWNDLSDICLDWGAIAIYSFPITNNKQEDCRKKCQAKAANDANFNNDNWVCANCAAKAKPALGASLYAYAKIGGNVWSWNTVQQNPTTCCLTGGSISCPQGWQPDWNGPGANKCKKVACYLSEPPYPPTNTKIGSWGFTWDNMIIKWGPATSVTPHSYKPTSWPCP